MLGDPERARLLIALLDGLFADELIRGAPRPDPATLRRRVAAVDSHAMVDVATPPSRS
ncbi:hypothetical protein Lfu02_73940 [Longispora fulva]|uniref:Uncharacterized protein n=1 Tax=Longispora fulva TaxID=619741 RepID=A0A8J7KDR0_9ACTN|nr:hypothetical protein [Longispora fulva]MBG6134310.1 hypothetical protein [Longispora fulva]GIG63022.1 hypothetical protein Lfu02_73940 [Longispora fulva]